MSFNGFCLIKTNPNMTTTTFNRLSLLAITISVFVAFVSCSKDSSETDNGFEPIELSEVRKSYVAGGNDFAWNLLKEINEEKEQSMDASSGEEGDFVISPLSVQMLLGLLAESAADESAARKIRETIGFKNGSVDDVRAYCITMMDKLPGMDKKTKVDLANIVLGNSSFGKFEPGFEANAKKNYKALMSTMSFSDKKGVVNFVNNWASEKTSGMIKQAIEEDDFSEVTSFILGNALYFKGEWTNKFDKGKTASETFTREDGTTRKVDMMKQTENYTVHESDNMIKMGMPYGNSAYYMTIYLPVEGEKVSDILALLASGDNSYKYKHNGETEVWLPRFSTENNIALTDILREKLGLDALGNYLFKVNDKPSSVSLVKQVAKISVDEDGSSAAAVTVATGDVAYFNGAFKADRPFVYAISETSTGAILFAGVYR